MDYFDKNVDVSKMYSGVSEKQVLGCILKNPELMQEGLNYINTTKVFYMKTISIYGELCIIFTNLIKI